MSGVRGPRAEFGVVEWLRPGEHGRVQRILAEMRAIGANHLRTGISWDYSPRPDGHDWYAWLLP